jgi:uncharacterized protein YuzE
MRRKGEVSPGIMLDFDTEGQVIGIEVLDVSERIISALPAVRSFRSPESGLSARSAHCSG